MDPSKLLVCPACHGRLGWSSDAVRCLACEHRFLITDGIPVLLLDNAAAAHDELDHLGAHHKHQQVKFFDADNSAEFEVVRPHGTPELYRWLMEEKFRRSMVGLVPILARGTNLALVVCGGSGMDAEFLGSLGARVITSDISIGAARRARERARRYGLQFASIVADVEHLPLPSQAADLVYVHDGLHHLAEPVVGLREMARVAGRAISVNEPARAAVTSLAVRLGLALEREEAGNLVARLRPRDVEDLLRSLGFRVISAERYAMYYRHEPGGSLRLLSARWLLPVARMALRLVNLLGGGLGNKLTIQAVRDDGASG